MKWPAQMEGQIKALLWYFEEAAVSTLDNQGNPFPLFDWKAAFLGLLIARPLPLFCKSNSVTSILHTPSLHFLTWLEGCVGHA